MNPLLLGPLLEFGKGLIDRLFPDPEKAAAAKLELLKMQQSGDMAILAASTDLSKAQLAINQVEAGSDNLFVSGWRPFIGWSCGVALVYQYIARPIVTFICAYIGHPIPEMPGFDENLYELLFAMLGIGGLRTIEKIKGVTK